ncbi:MAG TPA: hypothetical protein VG367_21010 [Mucilaginibacter sp.]|jgi:hypothetical protein|nr:hypothetical protein [Mucilaginibacter sp.]
MEFIRFLFIAILVLYIIRSLVRLVLPMLFQSVVNKAQEHGQQQQQYRTKQPEGKVKVDYIPEKKKSSISDAAGDFIDYEEVK